MLDWTAVAAGSFAVVGGVALVVFRRAVTRLMANASSTVFDTQGFMRRDNPVMPVICGCFFVAWGVWALLDALF